MEWRVVGNLIIQMYYIIRRKVKTASKVTTMNLDAIRSNA